MEQPLVSVVMATYNEPMIYLSSSIMSILNQTYRNIEFIIADDSTNEETINVIRSFAEKDDRILIIRHEERMGFVKALNEGLQKAKGKYIARMDGDDISLPHRLQQEVDYLEKHEYVDIVGGAMNIINETGMIVSERIYPLHGMKLQLWTIFRTPLAHPTVMFRSAIIRKGGFYDTEQKKAEDIEFWLRLKKNGFCIENLPDKLLNYRVVGDFSLKRNHEQWVFNYRARKKNFSWRSPLFSLASIIVSFLFILVPAGVVKSIYNMENGKKNK